eukprot:scaffold4817_cov116-Isochrysis_galbana.AAC.3
MSFDRESANANELAVVRTQTEEGTHFLQGVDCLRIDLRDRFDFAGRHRQPFSGHDVAQVLSAHAEESTLRHFARQTGPNQAFQHQVEAMEHLLERRLFPFF